MLSASMDGEEHEVLGCGGGGRGWRWWAVVADLGEGGGGVWWEW